MADTANQRLATKVRFPGIVHAVVRPAHPPDAEPETFVLAKKVVAAVAVVNCRGDLGVVDEQAGGVIIRVLYPRLLEHTSQSFSYWRYRPSLNYPWILDTPFASVGNNAASMMLESDVCCRLRGPTPR